MEITLVLVGYALLIAAFSQVVRFFDSPVSDLVLEDVVKGFVGAVIAVSLSIWSMNEVGADLYTLLSFSLLVGAGIGGMAFARAILDRVKPAE